MADTPADDILTPGDEPRKGDAELEARLADGAADADSDDEVLVLSPFAIEEETGAERNLDGVTDKLHGLRGRISSDRDAAQSRLREANAKIDRLDTVTIKETEEEKDEAHLTHGLSSGYINGIRHAISTLKSDEASSPTMVLKNLIEEQKSAALVLATKLVGGELAAGLVADREILLGSEPHTAVTKIFQRAQGLIREFRVVDDEIGRQEGVVRIVTLAAALSSEKSRVIEAEITLATLRGKKAEIETDAKSLLTQLVAALRVSEVLERSMGSTDSAAATLEGQLSELTTSEAKNLSTYTDAKGRLSNERTHLETARSEKTTTERTIGELQDQLAEIDGLIERLPSVLAALNAAKPLVAGAVEGGDLYEMIGKIGTDLEKYEEGVLGPINLSGTVIVKPSIHTNLTVTRTAIGVDVGNMRAALVRAGERLQGLVDALSESIATANAEDPVQLGAVENVLAAAEKVQRFISEEWPELKAGDRETIHAISEIARESVRNVLGPLEPLANFLKAGPDAWTEFQTWWADRAAAGGEEAAPDDGTGPVATPRDPLPAVEAAPAEGKVTGDDDIEVDDLDDDSDGRADRSLPDESASGDGEADGGGVGAVAPAAATGTTIRIAAVPPPAVGTEAPGPDGGADADDAPRQQRRKGRRVD